MAELNYQQKWYIANKERLDKSHRDYYHNNKEKRTAKIKEWQSKNKERWTALIKNWRIENKEYHKQKSDWKKANKRRVVLYAERRRSLEVNAGELTLEKIQRVYEDNIKKYGTLTCILCNKAIMFGEDSLEHLTPLSRCGSNEYDNLSVAHKICNSGKGNKTLIEWRDYCGR
jgi:hypothetical protein